MDKFWLREYESEALYKEKMKISYDQRIEKREFSPGELVSVFNSRLQLFPGKLKSQSGLFTVAEVFPSGVIELENKKREHFKVNGKCVKKYFGVLDKVKLMEMVYLDEV